MGPKRDIIRELEKATRNAGLKFASAFNWMYYVRDKEFDNSDPQFARLYGRPNSMDADDYTSIFLHKMISLKKLSRTCEIRISRILSV